MIDQAWLECEYNKNGYDVNNKPSAKDWFEAGFKAGVEEGVANKYTMAPFKLINIEMKTIEDPTPSKWRQSISKEEELE